MNKWFNLAFLLLTGLGSIAQSIDNLYVHPPIALAKEIHTPKTNKWNQFYLPAAFINYGLVNIGKNSTLNIDQNINDAFQNHLSPRLTKLDNYIQYLPVIGVYGLDLLTVKPQHGFWQRTKIFTFANALMYLSVSQLKNLTNVKRPKENDDKSFPSGHTATAFLGADFFYREFRYKHKWWIYSGYALATAVAVLRISNNEHWFSDVVAGAGFGILSNRVSYLIFDRKKRINKKIQ